MKKLLGRHGLFVWLSVGTMFCSCGDDKSKADKAPVLPKAISSVTYSPKNNLTTESKIEISVQASASDGQEQLQIDSITVSWNGITLLTSNASSFSLSLEQLKVGKQDILTTVHLSNGSSEKHYLRPTLLAPSAPTSYSYRKVNTYTHDPDAYTQGLFVHDGYFYESTGKEGKSSLRKVEIETGKVVQQVNLDDKYFGEGITLYNNQIFQLTYTTNIGFVYDSETLERIRTFNYPTEGWGLEQLGDHLIMTDGSEIIYFMNPETFVEQHRIQVYDHQGKVDQLNELEVIDGKIYANVYQTDKIVIINPESGVVEGDINLQGLLNTQGYNRPLDVLNGIAWDETRKALYVTGKWWPKIFRIEIMKIQS